ncbi:MAG: Arm DNA-binding domain-containing protein [Terracidiphilus sp.]
MEAKSRWGYSWGYFDSGLGVFSPTTGISGGNKARTGTEIRKAKTLLKAYRIGDGGGLYLWITPAGGKLWRWKYRHDGEEKLMSFGKYPDVTLALARERHGEARKLLANHALYLEPRAKMMQDWADFLEQTLRSGRVIPIRNRVA